MAARKGDPAGAELREDKKGEENPSDGLTKHVRQELAERYAKVFNLKLSKDGAKGSLQLSGGSEKR